MNELRTEVTRLATEFSNLKASQDRGLEQASLATLQERLRSVEECMAELKAVNERIESALKSFNEKMESQVITLKGVHLTNKEAINRILIRLRGFEDRPYRLQAVRDEREEDIGDLTDAEQEEKFKLYINTWKHKEGKKHNYTRRITVKSKLRERKKRTDKTDKMYSSSDESSIKSRTQSEEKM